MCLDMTNEEGGVKLLCESKAKIDDKSIYVELLKLFRSISLLFEFY